MAPIFAGKWGQNRRVAEKISAIGKAWNSMLRSFGSGCKPSLSGSSDVSAFNDDRHAMSRLPGGSAEARDGAVAGGLNWSLTHAAFEAN